MIIFLHAVLISLFALLAFSFFYGCISILYRKTYQHQRLTYFRRERANKQTNHRLVKHLQNLLQAVNASFTVQWFTIFTMILLMLGATAGIFLFHQIKSTLILSLMLASIPYIYLRMKLLTLQMKRKEELLPAVEVFYQGYIASMPGDVRNTLHQMVTQHHLDFALRTVFDQLVKDLMTGKDTQEALDLFSYSIGNEWAKHFAMMLQMSLKEGVDIREHVKSFIQDMRRAHKHALQERNRLLEIRIANFTPILFLALFIGINFYLDSNQAYRYYVVDPDGRKMILGALWLIFASFIMGIYLSVKRMD